MWSRRRSGSCWRRHRSAHVDPCPLEIASSAWHRRKLLHGRRNRRRLFIASRFLWRGRCSAATGVLPRRSVSGAHIIRERGCCSARACLFRRCRALFSGDATVVLSCARLVYSRTASARRHAHSLRFHHKHATCLHNTSMQNARSNKYASDPENKRPCCSCTLTHTSTHANAYTHAHTHMSAQRAAATHAHTYTHTHTHRHVGSRLCLSSWAACHLLHATNITQNTPTHTQGNPESKRLCRGSWAAFRLLRAANITFSYWDTLLDSSLSLSLLSQALGVSHLVVAGGICVRECMSLCVCV